MVVSAEKVLPRIGSVSRVTKETSVEVELNLDGTGICDCDTGIPFLDHMLDVRLLCSIHRFMRMSN